jgi:hypothetical protein
MNELLKEKQGLDSNILRLKDRVALLESEKLDADKLQCRSGDQAGSSSPEITCLEATERWLSVKVMLAETIVELAKIELAISRVTMKTDSRPPSTILKLEAGLAEAKVVYAEATVKHARTNERLSELRIDQAQNERDRQRYEKVFENSNMILKNANDYLKNANENYGRVLKELEFSTTDPDAMEGAR